MIAQNSGHIVTVASLAGLTGCDRLIDYCSSKFAAVGFDESLRIELAVRKNMLGGIYIGKGITNELRRLFENAIQD